MLQLPCIYWWYKTASHAAEVTAGFYNFAAINGYLPIAMMLKIHETALNLTCIELRTSDQLKDFPEASADPEKLVRKVIPRLPLSIIIHKTQDFLSE